MRLALDVVREAAEIAATAFREDIPHVHVKADGSPVTATDLAIEDLVRRRLRTAVPDDGVVGEERAAWEGASGRRWLVDPISGTTDFVRRRPTYSVDLGLEDTHGPLLAVSAFPSRGITMAAERGMGCRVNDEVVRVSTHDVVAGARVCVHGEAELPECVVVDNTDSVLDLITGRIDAIVVAGVELDEFDLVLLPVLVEEAGGRFTRHGGGALATNGVLHAALLDRLSRPTGESNPVATLLRSVSRPS